MSKNRGGQYMPAKKGDTFFTRPKRKFDVKKYQQKFRTDAQYSAGEKSFTPSRSGGGDFFVKPSTKKPGGETGNRHFQESAVPKTEKKPFDKKKYRLKTYSKKYKLQQWEEKRKAAILRGYYRSVKDDQPKFDVKSIYEQHKDEIDSDDDDTDQGTKVENENNLNASISHANENEIVAKNSKERKNRAYKKAYQEFQRIKEEKQKKREEKTKQKAEREEALLAYKKKKVEKFKKLSRKTKRGQPIMKDRLEMLLEKIQKSVNE